GPAPMIPAPVVRNGVRARRLTQSWQFLSSGGPRISQRRADHRRVRNGGQGARAGRREGTMIRHLARPAPDAERSQPSRPERIAAWLPAPLSSETAAGDGRHRAVELTPVAALAVEVGA